MPYLFRWNSCEYLTTFLVMENCNLLQSDVACYKKFYGLFVRKWWHIEIELWNFICCNNVLKCVMLYDIHCFRRRVILISVKISIFCWRMITRKLKSFNMLNGLENISSYFVLYSKHSANTSAKHWIIIGQLSVYSVVLCNLDTSLCIALLALGLIRKLLSSQCSNSILQLKQLLKTPYQSRVIYFHKENEGIKGVRKKFSYRNPDPHARLASTVSGLNRIIQWSWTKRKHFLKVMIGAYDLDATATIENILNLDLDSTTSRKTFETVLPTCMLYLNKKQGDILWNSCYDMKCKKQCLQNREKNKN